ncbi:hypothetical protein OS493_035741 [Desmophyllum pertusum]|uniref:Uncharacterized protein n=1 Tax=Desmophyllum pertusum TaxID=174260 RepID=A0A9W9ZWG9_9CNID|nr:hypothetical protein OS493_035741 [Desmophyllum pertusum]
MATSIDQLEGQMKLLLEETVAQLPDVYDKSKFNSQDLFAIIQGVTGFVSGTVGKSPFDAIQFRYRNGWKVCYERSCNTSPFRGIHK